MGHNSEDPIISIQRQLGLVQGGGVEPIADIAQDADTDILTIQQALGLVPAPPREEPDTRGRLERMADWARNIEPLLNPAKGGAFFLPITATADLAFGWGHQGARLGEAGVGLLESTQKVAAGILELPQEVGIALGKEDMEIPLLTSSAEWLRNSARAMEAAAEQVRSGAGLTDEEARSLNSFGEMVGYVAPGLASWKAAGFALGRTPAILRGDLMQDLVAGTIFGLTTTEGSLRRRSEEALMQAGFAGFFGAVLGGPRIAMRAYRFLNLASDSEARALMKKIATTKDPLTGLLAVSGLTKEQARLMNRYLSQETFITQTAGGVEQLSRTADYRAAVAGIMDLAQGNSTHGILHGVQNLRQTIDELKAEFPLLTIESFPQAPNKGVVVFGHSGMTNQQRKVFFDMRKMHGDDLAMIPGQRFLRSEKEYIFISPRGTKQVNALDLSSSTPVWFETKGVTPLFTARPELPTDIPHSLVDNFIDWAERNMDRLSQAREGMTDEQLAAALRQGTLKLRPQRDFPQADGAILIPEEIGAVGAPMTPAEAAQNVVGGELLRAGIVVQDPKQIQQVLEQLQKESPEEFARIMTLAQEASEGAARVQATIRPLDPMEPFSLSDQVELWAAEIGIKGSASRLGAPADLAKKPTTRAEQGLVFLDEAPAGTKVGEWTKIDTNLNRWERGMGGTRTELKGPEEVLARTGVQNVLDQFATPLRSLRPADLDAFKVLAERRWLERNWQRLAPEERATLEKLRLELDELGSQNLDNLEHIAAARGFHTHTLEDGTVLLRDINSGTPIHYATREAAMDGVLLAARQPDDFLKHFGMPPGSFSAGFQGRGVQPDYAPVEWLDPGEAASGGLKSATARILNNIVRKPLFRNKLDWLREVEEGTGLKVWTNGVLPLTEALTRYENRMRPFVTRLSEIFEGAKTPEVLQVYDYIRAIEGRTLAQGERITLAREMGLSGRQLKMVDELREIFDDGFRIAVNELGLPPRNYITDYMSKIQPLFERHGTVSDDLINEIFGGKLTPAELAWFTKLRTGNLSATERDLRLISAKYFRELIFDAEIKPVWDQIYKLVDSHYFPKHQRTRGMSVFDVYKNPLGLNDLPEGARGKAVEFLGGEQGVHTVATVWEEILMAVKGQPAADDSMISNAITGLLGKLGVKIDEEVLRTFSNVAMSNVYGATMGLRPRTVIRDFYQNWWNLYTRLGGKEANEALRRAMTYEGYIEALRAGAIRTSQKGLFGADLAFDRMVDRLPIEGDGIVGRAVAGGMKRLFNAGKVGRKASEKMLIPFSSQDDMLRAWAYHWQKAHTEKFIERLAQVERGSKLERKLIDDALPFYGTAQKDEFLKRMRGLGPEEALRFIGRQAADETNFIYGAWAQPGWLQTSWGRMAGTFSTWPMWQMELYLRRIRNGTASQRAAFVARTGAMVGAVGALSYATFTNLSSWMSPAQAFSYAGGPALGVAADLYELWNEPWNKKAGAAERIASNVGRLSIPGIGFFWDAHRAISQSYEPEHMLYMMMLGNTQEIDENYAFKYLLNPNQSIVPSSFANAQRLREERQRVVEDLTTPAAVRRTLDKSGTIQGILGQ